VVKPPIFNREVEKVLDFLITYRLFIRIKIRNNSVESIIGIIIYARKISKCMKEKHNRRFGKRKFKLYNCRRIFIRLKEKI